MLIYFVFCPSGMFLWWISVRSRNRGCPLAQRGWEEVVEEALLPPQGFGDLLRPKRQSKGQLRLKDGAP